ncbi:hypothetical protein HPB48_002827 [Haemaphysalis longicornis]|uniref:Uncharacterized protein n=1 Tax=Haemaphysalis longicornis TaxID=44386 RepID=A0A9J6FD46_HAELO|nr:hypothetical protein HPB48_002827 [Haemaphysalis longicornis]
MGCGHGVEPTCAERVVADRGCGCRAPAATAPALRPSAGHAGTASPARRREHDSDVGEPRAREPAAAADEGTCGPNRQLDQIAASSRAPARLGPQIVAPWSPTGLTSTPLAPTTLVAGEGSARLKVGPQET